MIDLKSLRADPEHFRASLGRKRYRSEDLDRVLELDAEVRRRRAETEEMRAARNAASREIPKAAEGEKSALLAEMKRLVLAVFVILVLVTIGAIGCAEEEPAITPGEGKEVVSSCVGCHSSKEILQAVASPEEGEESEVTSGEG